MGSKLTSHAPIFELVQSMTLGLTGWCKKTIKYFVKKSLGNLKLNMYQCIVYKIKERTLHKNIKQKMF